MKRQLICGVAMALVAAFSNLSQASIVGFGQLGGSNTAIPGDLASFAAADGSGFVVSNGATPNIGLQWDAAWDIHTSGFFADLENQTVGGGDWDNEGGGPRIAQLDANLHTITFSADAGYALVLNSFDMGNTPETMDTSVWDLTLTDSLDNIVWFEQVTLTNPETAVQTITPGFTGDFGESYTLSFAQVGDPLTPFGRHGIDNLSFNQISAVPEPTAMGLLAFATMGLIGGVRRRRTV